MRLAAVARPARCASADVDGDTSSHVCNAATVVRSDGRMTDYSLRAAMCGFCVCCMGCFDACGAEGVSSINGFQPWLSIMTAAVAFETSTKPSSPTVKVSPSWLNDCAPPG